MLFKMSVSVLTELDPSFQSQKSKFNPESLCSLITFYLNKLSLSSQPLSSNIALAKFDNNFDHQQTKLRGVCSPY